MILAADTDRNWCRVFGHNWLRLAGELRQVVIDKHARRRHRFAWIGFCKNDSCNKRLYVSTDGRGQ